MKAVSVFAVFFAVFFAVSALTESSAQPVEEGVTSAALESGVPACGPELDEAIRAASANERQKDADLNLLSDYLLWVEYEFDDGAMDEDLFLEEMAQGEAEYLVALAFRNEAAALHAELKAAQAACPAE